MQLYVTPRVELTPVVVPRTIMRIALVSELLKAMGATDAQIQTAQQGFAEGLMSGVSIRGLDATGHTVESSRLNFADIIGDDNLTLDTGNGRSMTEALSRRLARAMEFSANVMRAQGLTPEFIYHFRGALDTDTYSNALARFGLERSRDRGPPPGMAMRQVFSVSPAMDTGITYTHRSAWRTS